MKKLRIRVFTYEVIDMHIDLNRENLQLLQAKKQFFIVK